MGHEGSPGLSATSNADRAVFQIDPGGKLSTVHAVRYIILLVHCCCSLQYIHFTLLRFRCKSHGTASRKVMQRHIYISKKNRTTFQKRGPAANDIYTATLLYSYTKQGRRAFTCLPTVTKKTLPNILRGSLARFGFALAL